MFKKIGISVYPKQAGKEDTIQYIKQAHSFGFTRIFANLLQVNNDDKGKNQISDLKECLTYAKDLGMEVIVDIDPNVYKDLNLHPTEYKYFLGLGATGIRLDEDFNGDVESVLSQDILVELNASTGTATMDATLKKGGNANNLIACHNFYPMEYTGLEFERFIELTTWYKEHKVRTAAFITLPKGQSNAIGPWEVNDGMPTLEEHRNATLSQQLRHFLALDLIDDVILSQQGATPKQLQEIGNVVDLMNEKLTFEEMSEFNTTQAQYDQLAVRNQEKPTVIFEVADLQQVTKLETFIAFKYLHQNRPDLSEHLIRSTLGRVTFIDHIIEPIDQPKRKVWNVGDIVVLNKNYGRYAGELHIIKKEIPYTGKRNYIGKINGFDHLLIKYVTSGKRFKLIKEK